MKLVVNDYWLYTELHNLRFEAECDVSCGSLPINEFTVDIDTSSADILAQQEELEPEPQVGDMVKLLDDSDRLWARYIIVAADDIGDSDGIGSYILRIRAQSLLYKLDRTTVPAVMYSHEEVSLLIGDLLDLVLDTNDYLELVPPGEFEVSGYCPKQTIRDRLLHICMATGLFVSSHTDGRILITEWPTSTTLVPLDDTYLMPEMKHKDWVTAVQVRSYTYTLTLNPQQGDETVKVGDRVYIVTYQDASLTNSSAPSFATPNVVAVTDCGLINSGNASDVLSRLSTRYFKNLVVEADIVNNRQYKCGDKLMIYTRTDSVCEGIVESMSVTFGSIAKARVELVGSDDVPSGTLTVSYSWNGASLGNQSYVLPVGYAYSFQNPYLDKILTGQSYGDWSADPSWVCTTANTYLGRSGGRQFYKTNNGPAIVAFIFYFQDRTWAGPALISNLPENTYTNYGSYMETYSWEGETFYMNSGYHYQTNDYDSAGLHTVSGDTKEEIFNAIMDAAQVHVSGGDTMNGHRYIFRPTTTAVTGTMTAQGATATVQYAVALEAYTEQGQRILHIVSVDDVTMTTVGAAAVAVIA